ncbi:MAG: TIGR02253 family HAD-type hydrolase [Candidatus Helarchaeota archaeon]
MIQGIIFDLDDTLYNSTELSAHARRSAIRAMIDLGLPASFDEAYQILSEVVEEYGSNYNYHFDQMLKRLNVEPSRMKIFISAGMIAYHDVKFTNIRPFKDVVPAFIELKKLEIKICLLTDGEALKQYEKILRLRLHDFLDEIIISEEVGIRKPNPKLFQLPLERFNIQPNEAIYVGDNYERDIIPCMRLGIRTALIHRGGKYDQTKPVFSQGPPDFELKDLMELIPILKNL